MVEGELVLNAVKDSSLDSRRSERLGADPLRMTLIPDNLHYSDTVRGRLRHVTVSTHYAEFSTERIQDMLAKSGLTREEFYGSTKETARKIGLRADEYTIPLQ